MPATRLLFVDDEPTIRVTLPAILKLHGFEVTTASSVAEALNYISSSRFDVLISDLNIGQPGDGFTVVSAMRRTQPECVNLILTGYPAFETALKAIQSQVDDYLVKPADIQSLVSTIEARIRERQPTPRMGRVRVPRLLRENITEIQGKTLALMRANPELGTLGLSDSQLVDHIPQVLREMADLLDSDEPQVMGEVLTKSAIEHGRHRFRQGYAAPMLVEDIRVAEQAIFDVIQDHILELDLSRLLGDLRVVVDALQCQERESIGAFVDIQREAA